MEDGGENATLYWQDLKEQRLAFFNTDKALWRLSMASDIASLGLPADYDDEDCLFEWGGALRWLKSDVTAETMQQAAAAVDGHAVLFRQSELDQEPQAVFQPLSPGLLRIHQNLKRAFDPKNILNPGKLYPEL